MIFFCWLFGLIICEEEPKVIKEHAIPQAIPLEWKSKGPADPNDLVRLTFALKQSNLDLLEVEIFFFSSSNTNSFFRNVFGLLVIPPIQNMESFGQLNKLLI